MKRNILGLACLAAITGLVAIPAQAQTQQQKMAACATEWNALKAAKKTEGKKYREFQKDCLAKDVTAAPAPSAPIPAAKPATTGQPFRPTPAPSAVAKAAVPPGAANQFASEAEAKARCRTDLVVWVNLRTKVYHYSGHRRYGTTKTGAYVCEGETAAAGFHAAKREKRPQPKQ